MLRASSPRTNGSSIFCFSATGTTSSSSTASFSALLIDYQSLHFFQVASQSCAVATILPDRKGWLSNFVVTEPVTHCSVDFHSCVEGAMASDVMTKPHQLVASDRVEGTAVRRPNGDMIGHIERLMIDKVTGKVSYAILSFGGFLGIGANLIPLPWGRLRYNTKFEAYELDVDDEELKRAPSFRADTDFDWGDRAKEAELHRYYGMPPYWGGF